MDKKYWDQIYNSKSEKEVSWYQETPVKSLELIQDLGIGFADSIIDIGGGDSHLVDHLLAKGYENITVLDISEAALTKAQARLGANAQKVKFICTNIINFVPTEKYMLWHDRAAFHFLTELKDLETYLEVAQAAIAPNGYLILSTFSKTGPEKCSGLAISQYSSDDLKKLFEKHFTNLKCFQDSHQTPWGSQQNFTYCGFKKNK